MRARLQELSFTFHEARAHVMRALHPLLDAIVEQALPDILHQTLGQRLKAEIEDMAIAEADGDISLLVAPGHAEAAGTLLGDITAMPFDVAEDPALAAGQIHMRLGRSEREIDLSVVMTTLRDALGALDTINEETLANG
jgi:flagellar assembly protein FliH